MKLQQKVESSLDDIIKTSKKKPEVSKKSKGITRGVINKLKRLKGQRNNSKQNKPKKNINERSLKKQENKSQDKGERGVKNREQNHSERNRKRNRSGPREAPGRKKWAPPRRDSRFNKGFRGRNRN